MGTEGISTQLVGDTIYTSPPCPMCLAASYLIGIKEIYYAGTLDEAEKVGLGFYHIYKELKKNSDQQKISLHQLSATIDANPMQQWAKKR